MPARRILLATLCMLAFACSADAPLARVEEAASAPAFEASEAAFDATYAATPIALSGRVVDETHAPLAQASVTTIGFGANDGRVASGSFTLAGLARRSLLLRVACPGYYDEIIPVDLQRPLAEPGVDAGELVLTARRPGHARLIFAGDTMFGRRFVDTDDDGVEGGPGDLIRTATRREDATLLLRFVADALAAADFTQVNLETTVTDNPATPHPYKSFVYYSHPETILALPAVGVDAVSLGNNHVYDYLEAGVADTMSEVEAAGLAWFGSGANETAARAARLHVRVGGGVDLALQGFDQIVNDGTTLARYRLVAHDAPGQKGGALELNPANGEDFMSTESPDRLVIPVLHGGVEYSDYPTAKLRARFVDMVQEGAAIVVAHHPHVTQGVAVYDAGQGPRFVLMSLGNLLFDQDVFETFQSYLAVVDVEAGRVQRVQLVPFHAEDYVPKMVAGDAIARAGRRVGHLSTMLPPGDGLVGATVFPAGARIVAFADAAAVPTSASTETVTAGGPLAFARSAAADMLAGVATDAPAACDVGREIGVYGGFEDEDVDDRFAEGSEWDQTAAHHLENSVVHGGTGAAVLLRSRTNTGKTSLFMRHRVSFDAAHALGLRGFVRGDNAGLFEAEVSWYDADGGTLATNRVYSRAAGSYAWERFDAALAPPAGAASLRVYYRASPPASGEAATFLDDVAIVEWEQHVADASGGWTLPTPNDWSFVRCAAPAGAHVTLTHRTYAAP